MAYTHKVTEAGRCQIIMDGTVVNEVGPWADLNGADAWGQAICDKYNSPEYAETDPPTLYPNRLPDPTHPDV